MSFSIETRSNRRWNTDGVDGGDTSGLNTFSTREEAEAAIKSLRQAGPDWKRAEYRVVENDVDGVPGRQARDSTELKNSGWKPFGGRHGV